jgi:hypothetical protein
LRRAWWWPLLALAAGCIGTDVGNPGDDDGGPERPDADEPGDTVVVDLDVALYDDAASLLPSGARIELAWVNVGRVRLRRAGVCEDEVELDIRGPIPDDMLTPGAPEPLQGIELADDHYCRVDFEWDPLEASPGGDVPPALVEHSFLIEGERGDGTPFVLRSDRGDEIRLDAVDDAVGFPIDAATGALFVALDAEALFAGIDLDAAQVGSDGVIRIDDDENDELIDRFEANLEAAARLFGDLDGNGVLDEDERIPGLELAD